MDLLILMALYSFVYWAVAHIEWFARLLERLLTLAGGLLVVALLVWAMIEAPLETLIWGTASVLGGTVLGVAALALMPGRRSQVMARARKLSGFSESHGQRPLG